MKTLMLIGLVALVLFASACDVDLLEGHDDHDHDGDGVQDHAPEDHDDHDHDGDGEQDHAPEDHDDDHDEPVA